MQLVSIIGLSKDLTFPDSKSIANNQIPIWLYDFGNCPLFFSNHVLARLIIIWDNIDNCISSISLYIQTVQIPIIISEVNFENTPNNVNTILIYSCTHDLQTNSLYRIICGNYKKSLVSLALDEWSVIHITELHQLVMFLAFF